MNETTYYVGEVVRVLDKFWDIKTTSHLGVNPRMGKFSNQTFTIRQTCVNGNKTWYKFDGNEWIWDEQWFEPAGIQKDINIEDGDIMYLLKE